MYLITDTPKLSRTLRMAAHHIEAEIYAMHGGRSPKARNDALWNTHKVLEDCADELESDQTVAETADKKTVKVF